MTTNLYAKMKSYVSKKIKATVLSLIKKLLGLRFMSASLLKKLLPAFKVSNLKDWEYTATTLNSYINVNFTKDALILALGQLNKELAIRHTAIKIYSLFNVKAESITNGLRFILSNWGVGNDGNPKMKTVRSEISFSTLNSTWFIKFGGNSREHLCNSLLVAESCLIAYFKESTKTA